MHHHWNLPEIFLGLSLVLIAVEALLAKFSLIRAQYRLADAFASLSMYAGNIAMNLALAGVVFAGLTAFYKVRLFTWTPWIPLALLGFPPEMILLQQSCNLFYQFWLHTEAVRRMPAWFEYLFNTPSHHRVHHGANALYLDRNYAGVLMVWDRLFGTFVAERDDEPVRYGIVHDIATYNPIRIAFHEWAAIVRDLFAVRGARDAFYVLFGPPGWRADGRGRTSKAIRAELTRTLVAR